MTKRIIRLPDLDLYDDGSASLIFRPDELRTLQMVLSGFRFKSPEGMLEVANRIVMVEMHKYHQWQSPWVQ